jgi:hypothetical protein
MAFEGSASTQSICNVYIRQSNRTLGISLPICTVASTCPQLYFLCFSFSPQFVTFIQASKDEASVAHGQVRVEGVQRIRTGRIRSRAEAAKECGELDQGIGRRRSECGPTAERSLLKDPRAVQACHRVAQPEYVGSFAAAIRLIDLLIYLFLFVLINKLYITFTPTQSSSDMTKIEGDMGQAMRAFQNDPRNQEVAPSLTSR